MNKSFIAISKILDRKDWVSLRKYALMFSGEGTDLVKLLDECSAQAENLDTADMYRVHFSKLTKKGFQNLGSRLFSITEEWLVYRQCNIDLEKKNLVLNKVYNDHGLYRLADQKYNSLLKEWRKTDTLSVKKSQLKSQVLHQQYYSDNPTKYEKNSTLLKDLTASFLTTEKIQGLIYHLELQNWGSLKKLDYSEEVKVMEHIRAAMPDDELSIVLGKLLLVLKHQDKTAFLEVRERLYDERFEKPSELHTLITMYLVTSGIVLWQKGIYKDVTETARLIEYGLDSEVLMQSGKIPRRRFFNLIATLGKLKSYVWTEEFITRWYEYVETENQADTKSLAQALNAFAFGDYEKIIPLIRGVEFQDFVEKVRAQGLEVIAIYVDRKDNYALLRTYISNFRRMLKRNDGKLSTESIRAYSNFVKVLEQLVQRDFTNMTIHLENYGTLVYREWLAAEIKKG